MDELFQPLLPVPARSVRVILGSLCTAVAVSYLLTAALLRLAPRWGLIDVPAARKVHLRPTPKGGGIAIYLAFLAGAVFAAGAILWLPNKGPKELAVLLHFLSNPGWTFALAIVVLGLWDDFRPISWRIRLGCQAAVAVASVLIRFPGWPAGAQVLGALWLVAMVNAFNMLDNMDMLSAGVAWLAAAVLAVARSTELPSGWDFQMVRALPYIILVGALTGFLPFNRPPARIFMGDAGSTFLGFLIGWGTLELARAQDGPSWNWLAALCIAAVPAYDQVTVVLLRLGQGRSPFHADKQHLSHRLVARGLTPVNAVRLIHLLALLGGGAGLALHFVTSWEAAAAVTGLVTAGFAVLALVELAPFVRAYRKEARAAQ